MDELWIILLDGLGSAVIGALVAVAIVLFTVKQQKGDVDRQLKAQNDGIEKQLKAQDAGIQEQLRVQRRENARAREHEVVARLLTALRHFGGTVALDKSKLETSSPSPRERIWIMNSCFEELRLDLEADNDAVINAFKSLVLCLYLAMNDFMRHKKDHYHDPYEAMWRIGTLLTEQVVKYIRSNPEERVLMEPLLTQAPKDLELPKVEWVAKYEQLEPPAT